MASIKRFAHSRYWYACYTLPNGERRQRSTRSTDEAEALQTALAYEKAAKVAKNRQWSETIARRALAEIAIVAGYESEQVDTVEGFLLKRRAVVAAQHKGRTGEKYLYAIDHFLKEHVKIRLEPLHVINGRVAGEWKEALIKEGLGAATINNQIGVLQRQLAEAVQQGYLEKNPFEGLRIAGQNKKKQRRLAFSFAHFVALLRATKEAATGKADALEDASEWYLLIKLAGYTGQRQKDCAQFRKENVDLEKGLLVFRRGKNNKDVFQVPIHPALLPDIQKETGKGAVGFLLPAMAVKPSTGRKSISDVFRQRILPRIGMVQEYAKRAEGESKKPRKLAEYSFHSLRHSFSTWLNDAGVSDADRQNIVGHASEEVSLGYTHTELEHARQAVAKLPATQE